MKNVGLYKCSRDEKKKLKNRIEELNHIAVSQYERNMTQIEVRRKRASKNIERALRIFSQERKSELALSKF